jgi:diamine N-acetyltransferase
LETLVIKLASKKEIPIIQQIAQKTWPPTFKGILSRDQIEYMLDLMYGTESLEEQMTNKNHCFILATENNKALGFSSFEINNQGNKTKIHKLYVLPNAQGKGCGKLLLKAIVSEALNKGNEAILLNVNKYNEAVNFYKKLDFEIVKEEVIPIGKGYVMDDYVMEKKLQK